MLPINLSYLRVFINTCTFLLVSFKATYIRSYKNTRHRSFLSQQNKHDFAKTTKLRRYWLIYIYFFTSLQKINHSYVELGECLVSVKGCILRRMLDTRGMSSKENKACHTYCDKVHCFKVISEDLWH